MTRHWARRRGLRAALASVVAVLLAGVLASCNGLADVALPGGSATGGKVYHVKVEFNDVLDLVPQAAVRVNDVPVGDVEKIKLDGFHAVVSLRLRDSVKLPKNATGELRSTSLLGEKFVALSGSADDIKKYGQLSNGGTIPLSRTGRNPEFEEVFTALSALLNGGGVAQIQTISVELANAMSGREAQVKDVLNQLTELAGQLDNSKQQIIRALDSVDRLAGRLAKQRGTLAEALDSIPSALKVLADQRKDLTRVLTSLSRLGGIGTTVIRATHDNMVANLRDLQPVLSNLVASKNNIVRSLELLLNFPFPATSVNAIHGDYAGLYASLDVNLTDLIAGLTGPSSPTTQCPSGTTPLPQPVGGCLPAGLSLPTQGGASNPLSNGLGGITGGTNGGSSGGSGGVLGGLLGQGTSYHGNTDYTQMMLAGAAA